MEHIRYSAAACQTDLANPTDRSQMRKNTDRMLSMVDSAVAGSAPFLPVKLVVFPEFAHAAPVFPTVQELRQKLTVPIPNEHTERLTEKARAPTPRWNVGVTQRFGRMSFLGRVSYFGGWYDYDSGFARSSCRRAASRRASSTADRSSTWSSASPSAAARRWPSAARTHSTSTRRRAPARCSSARSTASTRRGASTAPTTTSGSATDGAIDGPAEFRPSAVIANRLVLPTGLWYRARHEPSPRFATDARAPRDAGTLASSRHHGAARGVAEPHRVARR